MILPPRRVTLLFLLLSILLLGGLGWATLVALRVEQHQTLAACEAKQNETFLQKQKEFDDRLRLALWRADARLAPAIAREESRPSTHYVALHSPFPALNPNLTPTEPGKVLLPSPLLTAELPDWMPLHFQIDPYSGWSSPQLIPEELQKALRQQPLEIALHNCTPERTLLLNELRQKYPHLKTGQFFITLGITPSDTDEGPFESFSEVQLPQEDRKSYQNVANSADFGSSKPDNRSEAVKNQEKNQGHGDSRGAGNWIMNPGNSKNSLVLIQNGRMINFDQYLERQGRLSAARKEGRGGYSADESRANVISKDETGKLLLDRTVTVEVQTGSMKPVWLPNRENPKHLVMVRAARIANRLVYQGYLIDWKKVQSILTEECADLFPHCQLIPLSASAPLRPDRTMSTLPLEFYPGEADPTLEPVTEPPQIGWSPLRIGFALAWASALIALLAVGLGGWFLLDLSERRMRFVSAVSHELRTPLTSFRLTVDLLNSGLIRDPQKQQEYLHTLDGEADRLQRLVNNVLDFARLEKTKPSLQVSTLKVSSIFTALETYWAERCTQAGKILVVDNKLSETTTLTTDNDILIQVLGNLIDNACKYSREAEDKRIILSGEETPYGIIFQVQDFGPGIPRHERRSIFKAFRRGGASAHIGGGVGLGLALCSRWIALLGGHIRLGSPSLGACFQVFVPQNSRQSQS
jgi:signal transduction histidine kinase